MSAPIRQGEVVDFGDLFEGIVKWQQVASHVARAAVFNLTWRVTSHGDVSPILHL